MPNTSSPILIADAGSTKTDWAVLAPNGDVSLISTQGINPFMLSAVQIVGILQTELLPGMPGIAPAAVYFYGAGCAGAGIAVVEEALRGLFSAAELHVASDLLGAARALCGHGDGIACILGTGSNSCLYLDGAIRANVSPLGFILGDEGSGAVLGRRLVGDVLKRPTLSSASTARPSPTASLPPLRLSFRAIDTSPPCKPCSKKSLRASFAATSVLTAVPTSPCISRAASPAISRRKSLPPPEASACSPGA